MCVYIDIYMTTHADLPWNGRTERWPDRVSHLSIYLSIDPSIYLSIHLSIYIYIYLYINI